MTPRDAIVVGAGPAGSAAAAVLAGAGARVLLVEKARFPRDKVCGEFLSGDALSSLDRIAAREAVLAAGPEVIHAGSIHLPRAAGIEFLLPSAALGISRRRLDDLLAQRAAAAGAEVRFSTRVLAIEGSAAAGFSVTLATEQGSEQVRATTVVGAWGRWDALDRQVRPDGRGARGTRYFGWSRDYAGETGRLAGRVRLYLFPGGYCGLSRVEDGGVNLAGIVSESVWKTIGGSWAEVVARARRANPALDSDLSAMVRGPRGFLGTVPVVFCRKPPSENGILMAGDGAGVLDPFSGQGQAAALASGVLAGETILSGLSGPGTAAGIPSAYEREWRRRFSRRFTWSAGLRRLILNPVAGALVGRVAGERVARFAVRKLWQPPD